jgi:RecG-like helicase
LAKASASANTLAARLARLGLKRDADFVLHLPLRYEDETRITALADARPVVPRSSRSTWSTAKSPTGRAAN